MSISKKYLGMVGHIPRFGRVTIVGITEDQSYALLRLDSNPEYGWQEDRHQIYMRLMRYDDGLEHLPLHVIFKGAEKNVLGFWWIADPSMDWEHLLPTLQSPVKKIYVKDLEELAELEQAKKAQESAKRSTSNQWRHQRHEAARAIFGVRKGRW